MNYIYWRSAESFSKGTYPWGLRHSLGFWCQEKQLVSTMRGQCLFCMAWGWMLCWLVETGNWFWILYHLFFVCYCISHGGGFFVFFAFDFEVRREKALITWPSADAPFAFLLILNLLETLEHRHSMPCVSTCENLYYCLIS